MTDAEAKELSFLFASYLKGKVIQSKELCISLLVDSVDYNTEASLDTRKRKTFEFAVLGKAISWEISETGSFFRESMGINSWGFNLECFDTVDKNEKRIKKLMGK